MSVEADSPYPLSVEGNRRAPSGGPSTRAAGTRAQPSVALGNGPRPAPHERLHTCECDLVAGDVRGLAVHIAARIAALGNAHEILTSSTVKDLVVGSGIEFTERGTRTLKGVPGRWRIYAVR